jgi:hypothetical protein
MGAQTVAVIGAILTWAVTGIVTFTWKWYYVRRAIESDICRQKQQMIDVQKYLFSFARKLLVPGAIIETSAHYEKCDRTLYAALIPELAKHSPRSLEGVTAFYEAVRVVDALFANFWIDVDKDKDAKTVLSTERIGYYLDKIARMLGYTQPMMSIDGTIGNLPRTYHEVDPTEMLRRVQGSLGNWTAEDDVILAEADQFVSSQQINVKQVVQVPRPTLPHELSPPIETSVENDVTQIDGQGKTGP